jgi:hypothetical protein
MKMVKQNEVVKKSSDNKYKIENEISVLSGRKRHPLNTVCRSPFISQNQHSGLAHAIQDLRSLRAFSEDGVARKDATRAHPTLAVLRHRQLLGEMMTLFILLARVVKHGLPEQLDNARVQRALSQVGGELTVLVLDVEVRPIVDEELATLVLLVLCSNGKRSHTALVHFVNRDLLPSSIIAIST